MSRSVKTTDLKEGDVLDPDPENRNRQETVLKVETEPLPCELAKVTTSRGWFFSGIGATHRVL